MADRLAPSSADVLHSLRGLTSLNRVELEQLSEALPDTMAGEAFRCHRRLIASATPFAL
jgi:hypothetical protein